MRTDYTKAKYHGLVLATALAALAGACGEVPDHFKHPDGQSSQALLSTAGVYGMIVNMTRAGGQIELAINLTVKDNDFTLSGAIQGGAMQASGQTPNGASQVTASVACADEGCSRFAVLLSSQGNKSDANASSSAAVLYSGSPDGASGPTRCAPLWTEAPVSYASAGEALQGLEAAYSTLGTGAGSNAGGGAAGAGQNAGGGGTPTGPVNGGATVVTPAETSLPADPTLTTPAFPSL